MARTPQMMGPFKGGLDQFTDPVFMDLADLQEGFNVIARNGNVQKRTGYTQQYTVVSSVATVPFLQSFMARNGSRYLFSASGGTIYKLT